MNVKVRIVVIQTRAALIQMAHTVVPALRDTMAMDLYATTSMNVKPVTTIVIIMHPVQTLMVDSIVLVSQVLLVTACTVTISMNVQLATMNVIPMHSALTQ